MEKALFGQTPLRITQGENGSTSHKGSLALDLGGAYTASYGSVDKFYAPWKGIVKRIRNNANGEMYIESLEKVVSPSGKVDYQRFLLIHTSKFILKEGDTFNQGQHIYTEGTAGTKDAHIHIEGGFGKWADNGGTTQTQNAYGKYTIKNQAHIYDMVYVPDYYTITASGGYKWIRVSNSEESQNNMGDENMLYRLYKVQFATESLDAAKEEYAKVLADGKRAGFDYAPSDSKYRVGVAVMAKENPVELIGELNENYFIG